MFNFEKSLWDNKGKRPFVVAHRGVSTGNIPCNTLAAYKIAMDCGADVVEIDVDITKDKRYVIFHPGLEHVFLKNGKHIEDCTFDEVKKFRYLNQDETITSYPVPTLQEAFQLLKGKTYIAVDKFWTDIKGITEEIYKAGVEKQVLIKIPANMTYVEQVEKYAPNLMVMMVVRKDDPIEEIRKRNINLVCLETLFENDDNPLVSDEYISYLHQNHIMVHGNSIVYDETKIIGSNHTDDMALVHDVDIGWGYYYRKGFDFVQTDWPLQMLTYYKGLEEKE